MSDLESALRNLPIALGLMDRQGRFIARFGALAGMLGDVTPARSRAAAARWRVFEINGHEVLMRDWPGERALRGEALPSEVIGLHTDASGLSTMMRISTRVMPPGEGDVCAISLLQPLDPAACAAGGMEDPLRSSFPEALVTAISRLHDNEIDRRALADALKLDTSAQAKDDRPLTPREAEVLRLVAWGYNRKEIATRLGIGGRTVEFHQRSGMRRLGAETRRKLVEFAARRGWMLVPP